jgi:hypothetical protein
LPFALHAALGDDVEDGAIVREDSYQPFFEGVDLDSLLEIVDLEPEVSALPWSAT